MTKKNAGKQINNVKKISQRRTQKKIYESWQAVRYQ